MASSWIIHEYEHSALHLYTMFGGNWHQGTMEEGSISPMQVHDLAHKVPEIV